MITVISRISQWNILMPTKVHDAHGLYRQCNVENDSSQNYIVISLRFLFSLPYIKKSVYEHVWSIISQLECSLDAFQPIISIQLSTAH